jgi:hypothetical protein
LRALRVSGVPIQECARRAIEGTRKVARMAGLTTS